MHVSADRDGYEGERVIVLTEIFFNKSSKRLATKSVIKTEVGVT